MSMSNAAETALLELIFKNTAWANVGDASGIQPSAAAGSLYIALHTADPGEAGDQTTSEATYTGYARVAVARSGAGWTVSGNTSSNAALIQFGVCTAGSSTVTYWSIGRASSGAGMIIASGALSASLPVSVNIQPQFAIGALVASAD